MPVRVKKLVGAFIIFGLVVVYAFFAMTIATYRLAGTAWWEQLLYFLLTGVLWVVPAMFVISWMERPAKRRDDGEFLTIRNQPGRFRPCRRAHRTRHGGPTPIIQHIVAVTS